MNLGPLVTLINVSPGMYHQPKRKKRGAPNTTIQSPLISRGISLAAIGTLFSLFGLLTKVLWTAPLPQAAPHSPHRMHSLCSGFPDRTISVTSRLIGQALLHRRQLVQFSGLASKRNDGQCTIFLITVPAIFSTDIGQR